MIMKKYSFQIILMAALIVLLASSCRKRSEDRFTIEYEKYIMPNGLQVILHPDHSDPMLSFAIMYHVGSGRERPGKTGFAHLFEHLLFTGSENVPPGEFDMILEAAGGSNNGFTSRDATTYFEEFPKNALEKVLWLESDRMGFFINSITKRSLAIQQNVVQNEKRQVVDNRPYGFTSYVINKNLYPDGHPYSWDVIGEMDDLKNATLDDVKTFYENYYGPNNATLVLSGDFESETARTLIDKYFGEINPRGEVAPGTANVPSLNKTVKLYHEDNFANVPEINLVWPVPQAYQKDSYALDYLARILASGKKAPLYKVLVKEKQLTSTFSAYNNSEELAGEFTITIRANEGKSLKEVEDAVSEAFNRFEKEGITDRDVERIKATLEKRFYENLSSILNKSINLGFYNTFLNDPGYIEKDIENIKAVTREDIIKVYNDYIKEKNHIVTSFVPKGKTDLVAENSVPAGVTEEDITEATQVEIADIDDEEIVKTSSSIDRTREPSSGPEPEVKTPNVWKTTLKNGIKVFGITNSELPLITMSLTIDGGVLQDDVSLPGVASMVAAVMPQGTRNKTPEELEEETELLGSAINLNAGREELYFNISTLSRNFDKTITLLKEMILEPRWDSTEFVLAKTRTRNRIIQAEAEPSRVANLAFNKLIYGADHIFGYNSMGTRESIEKMTLDELMKWYEKNISPSAARIQIAGNITLEQAIEALKPLEAGWVPKEVIFKNYPAPPAPEKSRIYFLDIPGSQQSVIYIGYPAISRDNPDYVRTEFINYRLGGAFTSILNQILREQKGFTYGARSIFQGLKSVAPFIATASVRSDATLESVSIFKNEMEKYRNGIPDEEVRFIRNAMIRSNALRFETNQALVEMLSTLSKYGLSDDYIRKEEEIIRNITPEEHKAIVQKYIVPDRMYYLVTGDASTQMKPLESIGFGRPFLLKN
ncbi:MAG TPA: peptidase M16 [Bacteroidales bacterium]|nr:peptidase M16 [Bacteroidales bacterium]